MAAKPFINTIDNKRYFKKKKMLYKQNI